MQAGGRHQPSDWWRQDPTVREGEAAGPASQPGLVLALSALRSKGFRPRPLGHGAAPHMISSRLLGLDGAVRTISLILYESRRQRKSKDEQLVLALHPKGADARAG